MCPSVVIITGLLMSAFTGRIQSASVAWVVGSSPVIYGKTMQLTCTISDVAGCCSGQDREWKRGSTNQLLLRNGVPAPAAASRFKETLIEKQNQTILVISNFDVSDYDMDYSCGYGFDSDRHHLPRDNKTEYRPGSTDNLIVQVNTLVQDLTNYKISAPKVFIPKIAPRPTAKAEFGDILLPVSNITEYDGAVFYNLTLTINADFNCPKDALKITVTAGTYTFDVYNQDICLCKLCALWKVLCSSIPAIVTQICIVIVLLIIIKKEEEKKGKKVSFKKFIIDLWTGRQVRLSHTILILVILLVNTLLPGLVGYFICTCLGKTNWFWIICGVGTSLLGVLLAKFLLHVSDFKDLLLFQLILFLVHTIVGILVGILVVLLCIKSKVREPHDRQAADNVALSEAGTNHKK